MDLIRKQSSDSEQHSKKKMKVVSPVKSSRFDALDQCQKLLEEFRTDQSMIIFTCFFQQPVDPVLFQIPTYFDVIKHPMDLQTMHNKFEAKQYKDEDDFAYDMRLMFENCYTFNGREHQIAPFCNRFQEVFEDRFSRIKKAKEKACLTIFDKLNQKEAQIRADIGKHEDILEQLKWDLELLLKQRMDEEASLKAKPSNESLIEKVQKQRKEPKLSPKLSSKRKLKRKASNNANSQGNADDSSVERAPTPKRPKKKVKKAKKSSAKEQLPVENPLLPESVSSMATLPSSSPETPNINEDLNKPDSEEEDTAESMTLDELRDLSVGINQLPPETLTEVIKIIQDREPTLPVNENGEVEVDFPELKPSTLRALEKIVKDYKNPPKPVKPRPLFGRGKTVASVTNPQELAKEQKELQQQLENIEKQLGMVSKKKPPTPPPSPVKESSSSSDSDSDDSGSSSSSSSGPSSESLASSSDKEN